MSPKQTGHRWNTEFQTIILSVKNRDGASPSINQDHEVASTKLLFRQTPWAIEPFETAKLNKSSFEAIDDEIPRMTKQKHSKLLSFAM